MQTYYIARAALSTRQYQVDNKIFYYRTSGRYVGTFAATDYPDLVKFYDAVYKADRNKIVLVRKESN